jgi:hypothetical protein
LSVRENSGFVPVQDVGNHRCEGLVEHLLLYKKRVSLFVTCMRTVTTLANRQNREAGFGKGPTLTSFCVENDVNTLSNLNVERKVRVPAPFMIVTSFFSVDAVTTGRVLPFCSLSLMGRSRTTTCIWPSMLAKSSVSLLLAFWILLFGTVASRHVSVLVTVTRAS